MKPRTFFTFICLLALTVVPIQLQAAGGGSYTVYIDYHAEGTNLNASWSTRTGEESSAIVCFREGGASVMTCGNDPCKIKGGDWPCWSDDRYRFEPEFGAVLAVTVSPEGGDDVQIEGRISRMIRVNDDTYRRESESFDRVERLGDKWRLSLGEDESGTEYVLNVRIEGSPSRVTTGLKHDVVVKVRYAINDRRDREDEEGIKIQHQSLSVDSHRGASEKAKFEAPVSVRGVDSSVVFTQIALKDVVIRSGGGGRTVLDATFDLDRQLAMGVQPSDNTGMTTINGYMISSSFSRSITLQPGRTVRIRIPVQDGEKKYIRTYEYMEIEWGDDEN